MSRLLLIAVLAAAMPGGGTLPLAAHLLGATAHTDSDAFADAQFAYDPADKKLDFYVNYDGVAPTKVDIHGPANGDETAPTLLSLPVSESPISGTATLTQGEAEMLLGGRAYIDIHSRAFPGGEIRGRIVKP